MPPEQPQLLTNDRKDHIILLFRQKPISGYSARAPFQNTAGADRIECLQRLEALAGRIGFRIEPRHDRAKRKSSPFDALQLLDTENYAYNCECSNSSYDEKWFVLRTRHKQHQDRNSQHDNRRAQVVGDFPDTKKRAAGKLQ